LGFAQCCGPLLQGAAAAQTAESLMRSRYAAYCLGHAEYLQNTWSAQTRPASLSLDEATAWEGLRILRKTAGEAGDSAGEVEFIARYRQHGKIGCLREASQFARELGAWRYVAGAAQFDYAPGRNDPCPCGSGAKYKKCCAR
jgi:SEC-C motif-containing protein